MGRLPILAVRQVSCGPAPPSNMPRVMVFKGHRIVFSLAQRVAGWLAPTADQAGVGEGQYRPRSVAKAERAAILKNREKELGKREHGGQAQGHTQDQGVKDTPSASPLPTSIRHLSQAQQTLVKCDMS